MIDPKLLRENPNLIREALRKRGTPFDVDGLLRIEEQRRSLLTRIEEQRHRLKQESEAFARSKVKGGAPPAELKRLSDDITAHERSLKGLEDTVLQQLALVPNIPHASVPAGDAKANQIVRTIGQKPAHAFKPKTHLELGESLGLMDFERAAKITGSHFPLFTGVGAKLERALIN